MILIAAYIHFIMPAAFAFLAIGTRDFYGWKSLQVFRGRIGGAAVSGFDLGNVEEFLQGQEMIDHPGGYAIGEAELHLRFERFADGF